MRSAFLVLFLFLFTRVVFAQISEVNAYWSEVSRTVGMGDFKGYAALYHEGAVLVNGLGTTIYPISGALEGWKPGFEDTKSGKMKAGVDLRFSKRLQSETTAHETGIFRYWSQNEGEEPNVFLANFEGLLVKKNGKWLMLMEYQLSQATEEEWEALK